MAAEDFFRIQKDTGHNPRKHVERHHRHADTSDQWNFGGVTEKRAFYPISIRTTVLFICCAALFLVLVGRLFYLQIVAGEVYAQRSEGNRVRTQIIPSPRGVVYDRAGKQLVKNEPIFYVAFTAADLPREPEIREEQLRILSSVSGIDTSVLADTIAGVSPITFRPVPLIDGINYDEIILLKSRLDNWAGLEVGLRGARSYPYGPYTSHVLGYLGKITADDLASEIYDSDRYQLTDYVGKSGIEKSYEATLKGVSGTREVEINVRGQVQKVIKETKPIAGSDITLTLDVAVQQKLYDILQKQLDELELEKGAVIALDPRDGGIIAAVSIPSYDNNIFTKPISQETFDAVFANENQPLFFRPLQGEYPSGSTFKPVIALAALSNGIITPQTTFLSTGGLRVDRWFFPDWQAGGHGRTDVIKALAESVNTFFYYIGGGYNQFEGLGIDAIVAFAKKLFYTQQLGVDYPSEADGFLPSRAWKEETKKERWYIGDTYNVSIGQGDVLVTPLQTTAMMAFLANGGVLYKPHFVQSIQYPDGTIENVTPEVLLEDTKNQASIALVRQGLKATGDWGSARSLNALDPFEVAGKTGTAQVGGDKAPHAWFTSFAPYDNPTIAMTVLLENGDSSNYAVAVAREFYTWYKDYITQ